MYHYYVRYSVLIGIKKVCESRCEIIIDEPITDYAHILEIENKIKNEVEKDTKIAITKILIEFYQFLNKDPDQTTKSTE